MFLANDHDLSILRPEHSQISPSDWAVLARFWYPVAVAGDVKHAPVKGKLLDVDLVVYRLKDRIAVALDRCPHRHIRLTAGWIAGDRIVCAFHGMAFNADGHCTRIPALGRDTAIPARYRLRTFRSEVRYGLVWACLDDASAEKIPEFRAATELGDDCLAFGLVRDWPASAPRQIENFLDVAHFPFVHPQTIGGDPNGAMIPPKVRQSDDGLIITSTYRQTPAGQQAFDQEMTYIVRLPFMIEFQTRPLLEPAPDLRMINFASPLSAYECRVFSVFALNEPSPSRESGPGPGDAVNSEDIAILGQFQQPDLPLDQKHEVHLPPDNVSLEYRKRLKALGLRGR